MQQFLYKFCREEDGQDLIEYTLIMTFVALACTGFLGILNPAIAKIWQVSANNIEQAKTFVTGS